MRHQCYLMGVIPKRAVASLLVAVVAIGASWAIPTFVWCPASESAHLSACCGAHDELAVRAPCCEAGFASDQDARFELRSPSVAPPVLTAVAAIAPPRAPASIDAPFTTELARAGPTRLYARLSIYLL